MRWEAVIFGPDDTEWEGGVFNLLMEFTEEYPLKPPKVSEICINSRQILNIWFDGNYN